MALAFLVFLKIIGTRELIGTSLYIMKRKKPSMKIAITAIAAILLVASTASYAYAEVPAWVKSNAGWWADGTISESEFLSGIEFLIEDGIIVVPPTQVSSESSSDESVPAWVKSNAGWWADGTISDGEFVNGIQHLITIGIVNVSGPEMEQEPEQQQPPASQESIMDSSSELTALEVELDNCAEINKAYDRLNCERTAKDKITAYTIKNNSQAFQVGPVYLLLAGFGY